VSSHRAPLERDPPAAGGEDGQLWTPRSVHRRRAAAARIRRRRLLVADVGLGLVLALLAIAIAPGLAMVALVALLVLFGCAASVFYPRVRARRAARARQARGRPLRAASGAPTRRPPSRR
jgi:Flp pilus assembly protein TadB